MNFASEPCHMMPSNSLTIKVRYIYGDGFYWGNVGQMYYQHY